METSNTRHIKSSGNARLKVAIRAAHVRSRETYGPIRLQPELAEDGFWAGLRCIKRLRRELGLRGKQVKATTNFHHSLPVAENLLNQDFAAARPGQVWVTDITSIPTQEGWLYLTGVNDVHTCEIVGSALGGRMTQELTGQALIRAVKHKRIPTGTDSPRRLGPPILRGQLPGLAEAVPDAVFHKP